MSGQSLPPSASPSLPPRPPPEPMTGPMASPPASIMEASLDRLDSLLARLTAVTAELGIRSAFLAAFGFPGCDPKDQPAVANGHLPRLADRLDDLEASIHQLYAINDSLVERVG